MQQRELTQKISAGEVAKIVIFRESETQPWSMKAIMVDDSAPVGVLQTALGRQRTFVNVDTALTTLRGCGWTQEVIVDPSRE